MTESGHPISPSHSAPSETSNQEAVNNDPTEIMNRMREYISKFNDIDERLFKDNPVSFFETIESLKEQEVVPPSKVKEGWVLLKARKKVAKDFDSEFQDLFKGAMKLLKIHESMCGICIGCQGVICRDIHDTGIEEIMDDVVEGIFDLEEEVEDGGRVVMKLISAVVLPSVEFPGEE